MAPYLPQGVTGGAGSPYSEGGALYALGLIHANHGEGIKQFLRDSLRSTTVEVLIIMIVLFCVKVLANCHIYCGVYGAGYSTWRMSRPWVGSTRNC